MSGIYIHFPFCKKKCLYCAFYSIGNFQQYESYLQALQQEIDLRKDYLQEREIETLYLGGGTPSLLKISDLKAIVAQLKQHFTFAPHLEFTLEGNPDQLTLEYVEQLKELGVNRLSIGIQSFDNKVLQLLGRTHDSVQARQAIENALTAGIGNVTIDLIYGIYTRSLSEWQKELQVVKDYQLPHFSAYSLTVEENSLLERRINANKFPQLNENQSVEELECLIDFAQQSGYEHYEVSNFALPGFASRHNSHYWDGTPYLGLGPSAHSFDGQSRQWNCASVKEYAESLAQQRPFFTIERLTPNEQYNEYILLHLRTAAGISLAELTEKFGEESLQYLLQELRKIDTSLYTQACGRIRLTRKGIPLTDAITAELFKSSEE